MDTLYFVMPAYNEEANIEEVVSQWHPICEKINAEGNAAKLVIANDGSKDNTGKVIALETIGFGGELVYTFCGKPVCIMEDQGLAPFDSITGAAKASKATAFAYFFDDSKYIFNSNMQLTLRQYIDESTDEIVRKATAICDGKVVEDDSLFILCRGVDSTNGG